VVVIREELPFLLLLLPIFYLQSCLPIIITYGLRAKERSPDGLSFTKSDNARLAALGALPVSITCFIAYPWIIAFGQLAWRTIGDHPYNDPGKYGDSRLDFLMWQYSFWPRWWRERRPLEDTSHLAPANWKDWSSRKLRCRPNYVFYSRRDYIQRNRLSHIWKGRAPILHLFSGIPVKYTFSFTVLRIIAIVLVSKTLLAHRLQFPAVAACRGKEGKTLQSVHLHIQPNKIVKESSIE